MEMPWQEMPLTASTEQQQAPVDKASHVAEPDISKAENRILV